MTVRSRHHRRPPAGYSLMETLVTIFLMVVVLGVLFSLFYVLSRSFTLHTVRDELLQSAARITGQIGDTTRPAFGIEASRLISGTTYTSDSDTLILKIAALDASGLPIAGTFDYLVLTPDAAETTRFLEITDADPASSRTDQTRLLGTDVDQVTFLYKNATPALSGTVYASITVSRDLSFVHPSLTLHVDAKLRNK